MKYHYYKNLDDNESTPINLQTIQEKLSDDEIIQFIGLAIMLKDAILDDDGEYRAIAIKEIRKLEDMIIEFSYAISH